MAASQLPERLAYSPGEVARLLGVSRQHLHNLTRRGELRVSKIGRATRIPASELDRLVNEGTGRKPAS